MAKKTINHLWFHYMLSLELDWTELALSICQRGILTYNLLTSTTLQQMSCFYLVRLSCLACLTLRWPTISLDLIQPILTILFQPTWAQQALCGVNHTSISEWVLTSFQMDSSRNIAVKASAAITWTTTTQVNVPVVYSLRRLAHY